MKMGNLKDFLELSSLMFTEPRSAVLLILLVTAAVIDVRRHRIPNWLTLSGATFALLYSAVIPFFMQHGFLWSLGGLGIGFGLLFPFYLMRIMGAGDVKLMAMAGALLGVNEVLPAVLASFIAGGVLAIGYSIRYGRLRAMLANVSHVLHLGSVAALCGMPLGVAREGWESVGKMPFGLAIATGTITTVVATNFNLF